ncbi:MAG: hypothetical protein E7614_01870 [Ruminococcaceae bacterium]|nr:hypothetical protein [Oscillospiraceae bacterium]
MNSDTIKLLKSCNEGCRTASNSMAQILPFVKDPEMKNTIENSSLKNEEMAVVCTSALEARGKLEREISTLPFLLTRLKNDVKLCFSSSPRTVASILAENCENVIIDTRKAIKNCPKADRESVELAKSLLKARRELLEDMIEYY